MRTFSLICMKEGVSAVKFHSIRELYATRPNSSLLFTRSTITKPSKQFQKQSKATDRNTETNESSQRSPEGNSWQIT